MNHIPQKPGVRPAIEYHRASDMKPSERNYTPLKFLDLPPVEPERFFRPSKVVKPLECYFIDVNGGMGDYIAWLAGQLWVFKHCPWIHGRLVAPKYFHEIARVFFNTQDTPTWKLMTYDEFTARGPDGVPIKGPLDAAHAMINATGAHLIDCGAAYFAGQMPLPGDDNVYPRIPDEVLEMNLPQEFKDRRAAGVKWAVITPTAAQPSRAVPGRYWTPICNELIDNDVLPVFLGKHEIPMENGHNIRSQDDGTLPADLGEDLRNKTSLLQAAAIMAFSQCVIGLDNGLLHLAGCTDAPIIFGYNLTTVEHRRPRRKFGVTFDITLTKEELACIGCQSNTNMLVGYDFRTCFYKDNLCITKLFERGAPKWISAVRAVLRVSAAP